MKAPDFASMDKKPPLKDQQFKRNTHQGPPKRRPSRKIFYDLKFVCEYISEKAALAGMDTADRSSNNVRLMYEKVEAELYDTVNTVKESGEHN